MARTTLSKVPSPRRASVASLKPSIEKAGMKFFTRSISSANFSSMRVPLVNAEKKQSGCLSQRRMMSFLRSMGSPPV